MQKYKHNIYTGQNKTLDTQKKRNTFGVDLILVLNVIKLHNIKKLHKNIAHWDICYNVSHNIHRHNCFRGSCHRSVDKESKRGRLQHRQMSKSNIWVTCIYIDNTNWFVNNVGIFDANYACKFGKMHSKEGFPP